MKENPTYNTIKSSLNKIKQAVGSAGKKIVKVIGTPGSPYEGGGYSNPVSDLPPPNVYQDNNRKKVNEDVLNELTGEEKSKMTYADRIKRAIERREKTEDHPDLFPTFGVEHDYWSEREMEKRRRRREDEESMRHNDAVDWALERRAEEEGR